MNLRDAILATPYVPELAPVSVPQWAGTEGKLFVRSLSARERETFLKISDRHDKDDSICFVAEVTSLVLVDEQGGRIFPNPADAKALGEKDAEPLQIVSEAYQKHQAAVNAKKKTVTAPSDQPSSPLPSTAGISTPTT